MRGLLGSPWALLPAASLLAGCEIVAGIGDLTYAPDGSASSAGSSGSPQTAGSASGSGVSSGDLSGALSGATSGVSAGVTAGTMSGISTGSSSGIASGTTSGVSSGSGSIAATGQPSSGASGATGSVASGSGSQSAGSGSSGVTSGASGASGVGSGSQSGGATAGKDAGGTPLCTPGNATGSLPFVVDSVYEPTGEFGDSTAGTSDACTVARSSVTAKGNCHTTVYTPKAADAGAQGYAGVYWQDNFDWGTGAGYPMPPGATKVIFYAHGLNGGEKVTFLAGYTGAATAATPCTDTIRGNTGVLTLAKTWTMYTMTLAGGYPGGVLGAFGWVANAPAGSTAPITFYVDDIQYQ